MKQLNNFECFVVGILLAILISNAIMAGLTISEMRDNTAKTLTACTEAKQ